LSSGVSPDSMVLLSDAITIVQLGVMAGRFPSFDRWMSSSPDAIADAINEATATGFF
jgi:hypothetical protein